MTAWLQCDRPVFEVRLLVNPFPTFDSEELRGIDHRNNQVKTSTLHPSISTIIYIVKVPSTTKQSTYIEEKIKMADALKKVFADRKAQVSPGLSATLFFWGLLHWEEIRLGSAIEDANFSF
jgi:hypothetical protein